VANNTFYRDFEAAFRGSRAEILQRLEVYLDFLRPLAEVSAGCKALDLGCGRGEWLEIAGSADFDAHGVDLDAGMLEDCFARGLSAEQGDAIAVLKAHAPNSHAVISGFHIAEHLPFSVLQELIAEALRVLEPGGLLILETPNPENIRVGAMNFHMDPTHNKPLPPGLLSFLPRHYGFDRVQILRLQEAAALRKASRAALVDVFQGVSPDYAVVAQKHAEPEIMRRFDQAFSKDRGLTFETLSERFEAGMTSKADFMALQAQVEQIRAELEARLHDIQTSTSWKITGPLRRLGRLVHAARSGALRELVLARARPLGLRLALGVHQKPRLRKALLSMVRSVPGLEGRLRSVLALRQQPGAGWERRHGPGALTPRGREIFHRIKQLQDR
jgi:O-antigen chain-terminating methyltransferase